jgi:transcriptional regulator with GAF, ATPase, and Fis domain
MFVTEPADLASRRCDWVDLIGESEPIVNLRQEIERVGRTEAKVLITGESGTGKEVVAKALAARGPRANRPFVPVNCAGLTETLLESELFGHVKGSFTGAFRDRQGKLELADRGTIFLDEIGETTLRMQGVLLRFLELGEIQKVGSDRGTTRVDVRVIAATNRNLREIVALGQFREDLYYRLNVIQIEMPPLRERKTDIPLLVDHFLERFAVANNRPVPKLTPEAMALASAYHWPGNVRELVNVIERLVASRPAGDFRPEDLPSEIRNHNAIQHRPVRERRRTVADDLYKRLVVNQESFWTVVYPLYMKREITRHNVRDVVGKGLEAARGNYKIVAQLFNMDPEDYKKFLNFLRKHDCHLSFKEFRTEQPRDRAAAAGRAAAGRSQ